MSVNDVQNCFDKLDKIIQDIGVNFQNQPYANDLKLLLQNEKHFFSTLLYDFSENNKNQLCYLQHLKEEHFYQDELWLCFISFKHNHPFQEDTKLCQRFLFRLFDLDFDKHNSAAIRVWQLIAKKIAEQIRKIEGFLIEVNSSKILDVRDVIREVLLIELVDASRIWASHSFSFKIM
ncbi:hypothetical protein [endosymbiont GvMRE of Glomus versiforme]|uniref:hypothetical protein n=1 Tax=endosymbiont GvMRE of Glomus versiforme TaxID=2039283 RepID=UPI000ECDBBF0|nr:hypothetical protein [endosymbiont GvMRE of Glomus versiforme]RHZ35535.1 hypothetical protein GvMRE_IIg196 [endosymbiont GvMRE of Glomus versiforme]